MIWLPAAFAEIDVTEVSGPGDSPRVVEYLQTTTLPATMATQDESPWCAAFVGWVLNRSGLPSTRSAMARSYLKYGESCPATFGAIAVLSRGDPPSGHVGFLVAHRDGWLWLLAGNQSDKVSVARFDARRLIDCRWPTGAAGPKWVLA